MSTPNVADIWAHLTPEAKARLEAANPEVPALLRDTSSVPKAKSPKPTAKRVSPWRGKSLRARCAIGMVGLLAYLLQGIGLLGRGMAIAGRWLHEAKWRIGK